MKTEVKPITTEGNTAAPPIAHCYTTGAWGVPIPPPWLSLCKQYTKSEMKPLPDKVIKCAVCLDLAYESSL